MCSRPFETRSLPSSLATTHRCFAFYVAFPRSSIRPLGLPIYVTRVPAAPFTRSYPRRFALITRTARACASYLAALPSTRAIPDRDVFYVAGPAAPFARLMHSRGNVIQR